MWIDKFQQKYKETRSVETRFGPTNEDDGGYKALVERQKGREGAAALEAWSRVAPP